MSPRRLALCKLADSFESFGHMLPLSTFRHHTIFGALPEMYVASGSYGATFTGKVFVRDSVERVILKVAWDD